MAAFDFLSAIIPAKKKAKVGGTASTPTFNPQQVDRVLTVPQYRDHLTDLFTSRQSDDSRTLLQQLFKFDPDVSAAMNAYLTMANTDWIVLARDLEQNIDRDATKSLMLAIEKLGRPTDYTLGFQLKKSMRAIAEELRYMCLLRGGIAAELIVDKQMLPDRIRNVDLSTIQWYEKKPGEYKPIQKIAGSNDETNLDIPSFFVSHYRKDPTSIYGYSPFVSSINTIAARQQVINDLYRIMRLTGFPRMQIEVVEEVLTKNAPENIKQDDVKLREWKANRLGEIRQVIEGLRSDQPLIHFDSVQPSMMNDQKPGAGVDITAVIETLNAQNQAALKTMATVIGRGASGVNTGSVEARIAAMNADELNEPVAELLQNVFSFILHQAGFQGFAEVQFRKAELRPDTELEPQLTLKSTRLRQDLSDGLITDDEYHLWMYGRLRPDSAPEVSGTKFVTPVKTQADKVSPNSDPLGRSLAPEGGEAARSN
ncbi:MULTISPECIES: hypothetical protein [unclassified Mesorhizobium]|uniref:hypothetical protein n=1 Tax=unclassified Mesorhizobium TaxID=325217 RepID=UPI000FDBC6E8|nr:MULTISPECIES: hypothetical protein [unclassified Mesorhizobium]TGT64078.1 hypothetical protein EN809_035055 [Mesorhizobium sp. M2E.F.Ca.ET.166.01.1.1]TGV97039.1 hypothetical protein EN797_035110 [Mesorhizobium sp. M2E.F.Ca.ET.154.01.1.1]